MTTWRAYGRAILAVTASSALVVATAIAAAAPAAAADPPTGPAPVAQRTPGMVTADALPTVQIDGVVWAQAISGNTVYAGGQFSNARPAGAAPGQNTTPRNNLLAYNLTTGNLITSLNPNDNGQVLAAAVSPDGSRLYIGGDFTSVNGQNRGGIAAFDTATGSLVSGFHPNTNYAVRAIAPTNTTVYFGGKFATVGGVARDNLAAVRASDGAVLGWAASTNDRVNAMVLTPDGSRLIVGGAFTMANAAPAYGLASFDSDNGTLLPWAAGNTVRNAGDNAAILGLAADSNAVYGSGYVFGSLADGNLEGAFSADPDSGTINWVEDCHGDTPSISSNGAALYTVSHAHYCGTVGGFPQSDPWATNMRHAMAFSTETTGILGHSQYLGNTYKDWYGTPSPSVYDWFPDFTIGSFTGLNQATWTVSSNAKYVVYGGEFLKVNAVGQQGLARFAIPTSAPNKEGPRHGSTFWPLTARSIQPGTARLAFPANWDRDDLTLTYKIVRDGNTANPIFTTTADSTFWNRPTMGYLDTGLAPGSTHTYRVYASDPDGNVNTTATVSVTVTTTDISAYAGRVLDDGASMYWRLDEPSDTTVSDWAGFNDGTAGSGVTRNVAGAIIGDSDTASGFSGTSAGLVSSQTAIPGPGTFTVSAWFKTTTRSGGKIVGFGNAATGNSTSYDRHIYMENGGRLRFGVYPGSAQTIASTRTYNDGQWHQVVASLGSSGMTLYVDGLKVASLSSVTSAQDYSGYWRVGGDTLNSWPNRPTSSYFSGTIDDVAVFPTALSAQTVRDEYLTAGYSIAGLPPAPSDDYGKDVYNHDPDLYWRLGDSTGSTTASDSGAYANPGLVRGTVAFGQPGALSGVTNTAAQFDGTTSFLASTAQVTNPTVYTASAWFKTATTAGGKILGFGNSNTGNSTNYDRQVYMTNDGRLIFGTNPGPMQTLVSVGTYNDNQWHQVVASQGPSGMRLYVDGALVRSNPAYTGAQNFSGYWRVGGDNLNGWPSQPTGNFFAGTIDEVAVYSSVLPPTEVANQYTLATGNQANTPPTAAFTTTLSGMAVSVNGTTSTDAEGPIASYAWTFGDGGTATGATANHTYQAGGSYAVTLTVTDSGGAADTVSHQVKVADSYGSLIDASNPYLFWRLGEGSGSSAAMDSSANDNNGTYQGGVSPGSPGLLPGSLAPQFDGSSGVVVANASVNNPTVYSEEAWFKTTTTAGGKIMGLGDATSGSSSNYDRHVYMDADGHINFGVWTGVQNVATSPGTYNDGQWHHVVATQGPAGMTLYLDGQSVATNPQTQAQAYVGYWRVGGDTSWSGAPYFNGQIADVAIYTSALSAATVQQHYAAGSGTAPTASFTPTIHDMTVDFDASASTASSGRTITGYAWDFGDETTGAGQTTSHTYTAGGSFPVKLTVTDSANATASVTIQVSVVAAHQPPSASFTATPTGMSVSVDGSASQAFDSATVAKYTWDWGDGGATQDTTSAITTHDYTTPGAKTITLVVTDSTGAASPPASRTVTPAHANPVAVIGTPLVSDLMVSFDGSGSSASDGATISGYSWTFGDGATSTQAAPSHTYAADGSYPVTLVVTDSTGAESDAATRTVSVSSGGTAQPLAADTFGRSVTSGWGSADTGGAWSTSGSGVSFSVTGGAGVMTIGTAGRSGTAVLGSVSGGDVDAYIDVSAGQTITGGGIYSSLMVRRTSTTFYSAKLRLNADGSVRLYLIRTNNGTETALNAITVPGLTVGANDVLRTHLQVTGSGPVALSGSVWKATDSEPATWQLTTNDNTGPIAGPATVGVIGYLSGSATNTPSIIKYDNLTIAAPGA
jgi:PKD repeat protein